MSPEFWTLLERVSQAGTPVLLIVVLFGGYKGWWVWGWLFDREQNNHSKQLEKSELEKETWKRLALENIVIATRTAEEAERLRQERDYYRQRLPEPLPPPRLPSD